MFIIGDYASIMSPPDNVDHLKSILNEMEIPFEVQEEDVGV